MSPKSVGEKLLVKPGSRVWSSDPSGFERLGALPDRAHAADGLGDADVAVVFALDRASLRVTLDACRADLTRPGVLWIAYRKANRADINRDTIWPILGEYGLRPISQVAIDEEWSALRFRPIKEGEPEFTAGR